MDRHPLFDLHVTHLIRLYALHRRCTLFARDFYHQHDHEEHTKTVDIPVLGKQTFHLTIHGMYDQYEDVCVATPYFLFRGETLFDRCTLRPIDLGFSPTSIKEDIQERITGDGGIFIILTDLNSSMRFFFISRRVIASYPSEESRISLTLNERFELPPPSGCCLPRGTWAHHILRAQSSFFIFFEPSSSVGLYRLFPHESIWKKCKNYPLYKTNHMNGFFVEENVIRFLCCTPWSMCHHEFDYNLRTDTWTDVPPASRVPCADGPYWFITHRRGPLFLTGCTNVKNGAWRWNKKTDRWISFPHPFPDLSYRSNLIAHGVLMQ